MNFPSQIFFNNFNDGCRAAILKKNYLQLLPFYMVVAAYCYYGKVHRTMLTEIVSLLLKAKYYRCFINLTFSESIRKNCDKYPSARKSRPKQLNFFNILILSMRALLLLHYFNHILVFFVGLFEYSLKFLTCVYRVTVKIFSIGWEQFYRSFIIKVDYLFYYTEFFNRDTFFNFSIFTTNYDTLQIVTTQLDNFLGIRHSV